jgi:hypothetical protein
MKLFVQSLVLSQVFAAVAAAQFTVDHGTLVGIDSNSPYSLIEYSPTGVVTDTLTISGISVPVGSAVIGGEVWVMGVDSTLGRVNLTTGSVEFSFATVIASAECLGTFGDELLVTAWNSADVNRYDTAGVLLETISLPQSVGMTGLDASTTHIYGAIYSTGQIHKYDLTGALVQVIDTGIAGSALSGLAYEASTDSLWVSTGFGTDQVLHFDVNGTPLGGFPATVSFLNCLDYVGDSLLGDPFCFGDSSGTACPCGNPGAADEGCGNSTGAGATLSLLGSRSVAADELAATASNLLAGQPALLFCADNQVNGGAGTLLGDGLRCAGQNVVRMGVAMTSASGEGVWGPALAAVGGWSAGDTRSFQVWYRDPVGSPCASGFNLTHGVTMNFQP